MTTPAPFLTPWVPGWVPGPDVPRGAGSTPAVTFPSTALRFRITLAFGADPAGNPDAWEFTDITRFVRTAEGVTITKGRGDGGSEAEPASCAFAVDNSSGDFGSHNPMGQWWPNMRRDTPLRVEVDPGSGLTERFSGFVASLTPAWDTSGNLATVSIVAGGLLRHLGQGDPPEWSPLRRTIMAQATRSQLVAYWPCEDGSNAETAASALPGQEALTGTGTLTFGSVDPGVGEVGGDVPWYGTKDLPDLLAGGGLAGPIAGASASAWTIAFTHVFDVATHGSDVTLAQWQTPGGTYTTWRIVLLSTDAMRLIGTDTTGTDNTVFTSSAGTETFAYSRVDAVQSGSSVVVRLYRLSGVITATATLTSHTLAAPTYISINPNLTTSAVDAFAIGHVQVWRTHEAPYLRRVTTIVPMDSYLLERAADRLVRLSTEGGLRINVDADFSTSIQMGWQPDGTLLELLRECEATDGGILSDAAPNFRLQYRDRQSHYNQDIKLTANMGLGQVAPPFQPIDDDRYTHNEVTASRTSTTEATYADDEHIAAHRRYTHGVTVNPSSDSTLPRIAEWLVHLGTFDNGYRYPNLNLNFAASPELLDEWLTVDLGDRIRVGIDLVQHPPCDEDLLVEGWTEYLNQFQWTVSLVCSPYRLWEVFEVEGSDNRGRPDTGGSTLGAAVDADDTTLVVGTDTGPVWTTTATYPADFPFDAEVGGEHVTVTAIASAATDAFTRVESNGWGTADSGQTWSTVGGASQFSVDTDHAEIAPSTLAADRRAWLDTGSSDHEVVADVSADALPASGTLRMGVAMRYLDDSNLYHADVQLSTAGGMTLVIRKRVAGTGSTVTSQALAPTYSAGAVYSVRARCDGSRLRAKVWLTSEIEPVAWDVDVTDTSVTAGTGAGCVARNESAATTHVFSFDNFGVPSPQTFTVTRSVSGVTKSHTVGAAVSLWHPPVIAR